MSTLRGKLYFALRHVWRLGVEVVRKYSEDRGPLMAAAISFFALLSIIPLVLLGVWGLGHILSSQAAYNSVVDYLEEYLPGSSGVVEPYLQALVRSQRTIGLLGLIGLIWSASQGFVVLELAINMIMRVPQRRSFIESRLLGIGMIMLSGGALLLSLLITSTLASIRAYSLRLLGAHPGQVPLLWSIVGLLVSVSLTLLSFIVVYRVVPNTRVSWRAAVIGGVTAGLCWEIAKRAFASYLPHATANAIKQVYGSVAGVIGVVVWIYYSSVILVLGAELVSVLQNVHPNRPSEMKRRSRPGSSRERRHQSI